MMNNKSKVSTQRKNNKPELNNTQSLNIKEFLKFPNKLNSSAILLLLVLYLILLILVTYVVVPVNNYTILPDYDHKLNYDGLNSYLKVSSVVKRETVSKQRRDGTSYEVIEAVPKYTVTAHVSPKVNQNVGGYEFYFSSLYADGTLDYYPSNIGSPTTKVHSYYMLSSQRVKGDSIETIFGRIKYKNSGEDSEYTYKEHMLKLAKKELNDKKFKEAFNSDQLSFNLKIKEDTVQKDRYNGELSFTVKEPTKKYHLDLQVWVITEDKTIYPYLGVYNFQTSEGKFNSYMNEEIYKEIKPKTIFIKINFYNENNVLQSYYYKQSFDSYLTK